MLPCEAQPCAICQHRAPPSAHDASPVAPNDSYMRSLSCVQEVPQQVGVCRLSFSA